MTYTVYECDKIKYMQAPENEVALMKFPTAREAMDKANELARKNRDKSYTVG